MQTYQNNKKLIISVIVLILIGASYYSYKSYEASSHPLPIACDKGYKFNILTGKPCPSDTDADAATAEAVASTTATTNPGL